MKRLNTWIVGVLLVVCLVPLTAQAAGIELSIGGWKQSPGGNLSIKAVSALDTLDIKDNLKYGNETRLMGRIKIDTPLFFPNIYLMATPMSFKEIGSKNGTFQFGDVTFNGNAPFTSELKLDHYDVGFLYGIPLLKTATAGILNIDLGLNARIIDFNARITGQDTNNQPVTESKAVVIPMPMLYAGFQVKPVKWIALEGEARGIVYGKNHYYDLMGRVKVKPYGPIFGAAGYRYEKVKLDVEDVKAKVDFGGPFAEVGLEF
jgi:outer membrane protein